MNTKSKCQSCKRLRHWVCACLCVRACVWPVKVCTKRDIGTSTLSQRHDTQHMKSSSRSERNKKNTFIFLMCSRKPIFETPKSTNSNQNKSFAQQNGGNSQINLSQLDFFGFYVFTWCTSKREREIFCVWSVFASAIAVVYSFLLLIVALNWHQKKNTFFSS